jgi:ribonuclease HII
MNDLYKYEHELQANGITYIGGVDEVGRGPLIGPVVTACVVLPSDFILEGLNDSKQLSEKKRDLFYGYILEHCLSYGIGVVGPERIDEINIYQATKEAMYQAIKEARSKIKIEHILIDAMPLDLDIPTTSIIKGDAKSISIAAASVVAKVTRDRMMYELDKLYPNYGFGKHKGYPTKSHLEAINKYGLIDGYRKSYGPVREYLKEGIINAKSKLFYQKSTIISK